LGSAAGYLNGSGATNVAWQWQAGQGSTSSNTSGSITSTTSVNTTAGFSVVTYTGTGVSATIGHGLGVAPKMIIAKNRSSATNWPVYTAAAPNAGVNEQMYLNLINAMGTAAADLTSVGASTFAINTWAGLNASGNTYVAYCWAEIAGFSKFGS
jgi:hypothetical protein